MAKYLDDNGLLYFWQKIKSGFVTDVSWDSTNKKLQKTKNGSISDLVTLSTVATTGDYSDLSNVPALGTAAGKNYSATIGSSVTGYLPTVGAVIDYVATAITGAAAFQGTAPNPFAPTDYKKGWYWIVGTAGTYVGEACEVGDMIFALSDYVSAYSANDFAVIQTNLDIASITNAEIDIIVAS